MRWLVITEPGHIGYSLRERSVRWLGFTERGRAGWSSRKHIEHIKEFTGKLISLRDSRRGDSVQKKKLKLELGTSKFESGACDLPPKGSRKR